MNPYALWFDEPLVVIDFETTHPEPTEARAVEIGAARFERGLLVDAWSSFLRPDIPIPPDATQIHGISDATVADAPTLVHVLPDLLHITRDAHPVAYNSAYDRTVLHCALARTPLTGLERIPIFDPELRWFCPLTWIRVIDAARKNTLDVACARHGVPTLSSHRAKADAVATGMLLYTIANAIGPMTMTELLRQQQGHYEDQERKFAVWRERDKRRTG